MFGTEGTSACSAEQIGKMTLLLPLLPFTWPRMLENLIAARARCWLMPTNTSSPSLQSFSPASVSGACVSSRHAAFAGAGPSVCPRCVSQPLAHAGPRRDVPLAPNGMSLEDMAGVLSVSYSVSLLGTSDRAGPGS